MPIHRIFLPKSLDATDIQVPALSNSVLSLSPTTSVAATGALPVTSADGCVVRVAATEDVYIRFDTSAVAATSTDTVFPRGVESFMVPRGASHFSALAIDTDGEVTVTFFAGRAG